MEYTGTTTPDLGGPSCKVMLLLPEEVETFWEGLAPLIEQGLDSLELTIEDVHHMANSGWIQVWGMYENDVPVLAMVSQFMIYPRRKVMHILSIGGSKLLVAQQFWPKVQDFMMRNDCAVVTALCKGRMSHVLLQRFGFTKRYDFVERTFYGGLH